MATAQDEQPSTTVLISVAEQKLVILRDGGWIKKYPISTSKFGLGDAYGSYKTPLGKLRVCEKIGNDLTPGAVLKQRHATGEVLPANSPGRDPIVTRIIWLDGLEPQNVNSRSRGIYIHGTVEESKIGEPVSYGCIRMRSQDVVEVFDAVPMDTTVSIIAEKLPKLAKYTPPKPQAIVAAKTKAPPLELPPIASKGPPSAPTTAVEVAQTRATLEKAAKTEFAPGANVTLKKPEAPINPGASLALKGSILDAGLPEGPRIPTLPAPTESKDVPRFGTITPGMQPDSAFSLEGISRDLTPAVKASDADAAKREAAAKSDQDAAKREAAAKTDQDAETTKAPAKIAFRNKAAAEKEKR